VAYARGDDANKHFACLRTFEVDLLDAERFTRFPSHSCSGFHRWWNSIRLCICYFRKVPLADSLPRG
jgi:hypothetical protein